MAQETKSVTSDVVIASPSTSVLFDSALNVITTARSTVTSHPVEDGASISDHVVNENVVVTIKGIISAVAHKIGYRNVASSVASIKVNPQEESIFSFLPFVGNKTTFNGLQDIEIFQALSNGVSPSEARARLFEMRQKKELLTVTTPTDQYSDMVITAINEPRDASHGGPLDSPYASWEVSVDLMQVRIVRSGAATVPVAATQEEKADEVNSTANTEEQGDLSAVNRALQ